MSGYSRGNPAMGDVVRSVLVLGVGLLVVWLFSRLLANTPENPTSEVDWRTAAAGVEGRAGFVPLVPDDVPDRWRATRAELIDGRWQLNLVTGDQEYVGLSQRAGDAKGLQSLVEERAPGGEDADTVRIDGRAWQVRTGPEDTTTFARVIGREAVVVTGSADRDVLEDYVASLEPFAP
jgi:hypothetical protein